MKIRQIRNATLRINFGGVATICRDLKGIDTGKVLCSCENCVRNAVRAAGEALSKD